MKHGHNCGVLDGWCSGATSPRELESIATQYRGPLGGQCHGVQAQSGTNEPKNQGSGERWQTQQRGLEDGHQAIQARTTPKHWATEQMAAPLTQSCITSRHTATTIA